ncbi:MAG: hypothetical protein GX361_00255 [Bacteroidales bacterium]|nr:hypothetical protein [Bacteroidales bacterium]
MKKITFAVLCFIAMAWTAAAQTDVPKITLSFNEERFKDQEVKFYFVYARDEADAKGKKTYIDWGDGVKKEVIDQNKTPIEIEATGIYKGGTIKIYAPDIYRVENYYVNKVTNIDVSNTPELEELSIDADGYADQTNTLEHFDLSKNTKLKKVSVNGVNAPRISVMAPDLQEFTWKGGKLQELDLSDSPKLYHLDVRDNMLFTLRLSPEVKNSHLQIDPNSDSGKRVNWHYDISNNLLTACAINYILENYVPTPTGDERFSLSYDPNSGIHGIDNVLLKSKASFAYYGNGKVSCGDDLKPIKETPDIVLTVEPDLFYSFLMTTADEKAGEARAGSSLIQVDWGDGKIVEYVSGSLQPRGNVVGYAKGSEIKFYLEDTAMYLEQMLTTDHQPVDGSIHILKVDLSNNPDMIGLFLQNNWGTELPSKLQEVILAPESYDLNEIMLEGDISACTLNKLYDILPDAADASFTLMLLGKALENAKISNTAVLYEKGWQKITYWDENWNEVEVDGDNSAVCDDTSVAEVSARDWGIRAEGSALVVPTAAGEIVTVYNALGAKIAEVRAAGEETRINNLMKNQIVIVRSGDRSAKVVL